MADLYTGEACGPRIAEMRETLSHIPDTPSPPTPSFGLPVVADISAEIDKPFQRTGTPSDPETFFGVENLQKIRDVCAADATALGYEL